MHHGLVRRTPTKEAQRKAQEHAQAERAKRKFAHFMYALGTAQFIDVAYHLIRPHV